MRMWDALELRLRQSRLDGNIRLGFIGVYMRSGTGWREWIAAVGYMQACTLQAGPYACYSGTQFLSCEAIYGIQYWVVQDAARYGCWLVL
jgi:hypothetical protein